MFEKLLPYDAAHLILGDYMSYHHQYKRITKRAKIRFEHRDWHGIQADARERNTLYRKFVGDTTDRVLKVLGEARYDRDTWRAMRHLFFEEVVNFNTRNIAETYYNSVYRHSHRHNQKVDEELMFVRSTGTYREFRSRIPIYHTLLVVPPLAYTIRQIFHFYSFDVPFENIERDITYITRSLKEKFFKNYSSLQQIRLELLKSVFFRNKCAYIVGRLLVDEAAHPFVLPLLNEKNGIYVDTVLLDEKDVSSIFSYNRSYFMTDTDIASEMVDFLRSILPTKELSELYNSIGFVKHGKTIFYREFLTHMMKTQDKFVIAPGIKGMVMSVFTLPSYNMVFKLVRDRFAPPKNVTEQQVKEKYELVSLHDRVGRMADSHFFQNFVFDKKRFTPELLEELKNEIPSKLIIKEDTIEIKYLYIEKRMIPLNIYLETATMKEATHVIDEYGLAIKQLAAVNIFPGDMLLKNFGVTRLNRVVFYDYDEIDYLTKFNFRIIPEPRDEYDEMASGAWFHVGEFDIFPEEFPRFLIGRREIRDLFKKIHGDLFGVKFWRTMQKRLNAGEIMDIFPYRIELRFKNKFVEEDEKLLVERTEKPEN